MESAGGGRPVLYDDALGGLPDWDIWLKLGRMGKLHNFAGLFTCYTLWSSGVSFTGQKSNARSALRIVWKHRKVYGCLTPAWAWCCFTISTRLCRFSAPRK